MAKKGKENLEEVDDVILLESKNDNILDNVNFVDDEIVGVDGVIMPKVGMKFNDERKIYNFYKRYAYDVGFPIIQDPICSKRKGAPKKLQNKSPLEEHLVELSHTQLRISEGDERHAQVNWELFRRSYMHMIKEMQCRTIIQPNLTKVAQACDQL